MKTLLTGLVLASIAAAAGLPMSKELRQRDVTIMLGVHKAVPFADLPFGAIPDGVQVMVRSENPDVDSFVITVRATVGEEIVSRSTTVQSSRTLPFAIAIVPFGSIPANVLSVSVEPALRSSSFEPEP